MDLQVFRLVELDNCRPLTLAAAREGLIALLQQGAQTDCSLAFKANFRVDRDGLIAFDGEPLHLTALELAAFQNQPKWLNIFAETGQYFDRRELSELAALNGSRRFLWELHESGLFDAKAVGSMLHHVAVENPELLTELIQWGADPNESDDQGRTALHFAREPAISLLLREGGNPNVADDDGVTPFQNFVSSADRRVFFRRARDPETTLLHFVAFGLRLESLVISEDELIEAGEWLRGYVNAGRARDAVASSNPALVAARMLLKSLAPQMAMPPRRRPDANRTDNLRSLRTIVHRASGVSDLLLPAEENEFHSVGDAREDLPLATPIDQAVFDLIERDAAVPLPHDAAKAAMQQLFQLGATIRCCRSYEVWSEIVVPEDWQEAPYYADNENFLAFFTPLDFAVHLNVPKWIGIFEELGATKPADSSAPRSYKP